MAISWWLSGCERCLSLALQVLALMVEPLDSGTWMMVDGEVVQNQPIYVDVHPGLARVLVAPGVGDTLSGDM